MRSVIFDLDGTLVDTAADLIVAANACFRDLGHGDLLDMQADRATAVRGARAMLRLGFSRLGEVDDTAVAAQIDPLLSHYRGGIDTHSRFYPGALAAAGALRARGIAVGIATNKPYDLADLLMVRLGARAAFGPLVGADTLPVRKPDPAHFWEAVDRAGGDRGRALLVGDTTTDRETARAAGVPSVLVGFGPAGDAVGELAPEAVLAAYADLPDLAERLLA